MKNLLFLLAFTLLIGGYASGKAHEKPPSQKIEGPTIKPNVGGEILVISFDNVIYFEPYFEKDITPLIIVETPYTGVNTIKGVYRPPKIFW